MVVTCIVLSTVELCGGGDHVPVELNSAVSPCSGDKITDHILECCNITKVPSNRSQKKEMLGAATSQPQWEMKRLKEYVCSVNLNLKPRNVQKLGDKVMT